MKDIDRFCKRVGDFIADEGDAQKNYRLILQDSPNKSSTTSIQNIKSQEARHQRTLQRMERKYCLRRRT